MQDRSAMHGAQQVGQICKSSGPSEDWAEALSRQNMECTAATQWGVLIPPVHDKQALTSHAMPNALNVIESSIPSSRCSFETDDVCARCSPRDVMAARLSQLEKRSSIVPADTIPNFSKSMHQYQGVSRDNTSNSLTIPTPLASHILRSPESMHQSLMSPFSNSASDHLCSSELFKREPDAYRNVSQQDQNHLFERDCYSTSCPLSTHDSFTDAHMPLQPRPSQTVRGFKENELDITTPVTASIDTNIHTAWYDGRLTSLNTVPVHAVPRRAMSAPSNGSLPDIPNRRKCPLISTVQDARLFMRCQARRLSIDSRRSCSNPTSSVLPSIAEQVC